MAHPFFRKGQLKSPVRFVFNGTSLEVDYVDAIKALLSATAVNKQKKYSSTAATAETVLCSACAHKPSGLFLLPPLHVTPFLFFFPLLPVPFSLFGHVSRHKKKFSCYSFFFPSLRHRCVILPQPTMTSPKEAHLFWISKCCSMPFSPHWQRCASDCVPEG